MKLATFVCLFLFATGIMVAQSNSATASQEQAEAQASNLRLSVPSKVRDHGDFKGFANRSELSNVPGAIFGSAAVYNSGGALDSSAIVVDVNGDGKPDVLVLNMCSSGDVNCLNGTNGMIGVLLGNGDGTLQPAVTYDSGGYRATSLAASDINSDGKVDLLVGNNCVSANPYNCANGVVGVLLGNGDGTFQPAVSYEMSGPVYLVVAADVNGDGKPDLLVANYCSSCTTGAVEVLVGNGDGTFRPAVSYDSGTSGSITSLAVADVNRDGKPDLVIAEGTVLLGVGDGTFEPAIPWVPGASYVTVADLNGDGAPDLAVPLGVLLGNGDGTFQTETTYASGGYAPRGVAAVDLNLDGKPDLAVANLAYCSTCFGGDVGVLLGNGDGTFQSAVAYDGGAGFNMSVAVVPADLNGDGKPDLVVVNECDVVIDNCKDSTIGVLINVSPFPTTTVLVSLPNPSSIGQSVTFTATVTPRGNGVPTGTVTFLDGATNLSSPSLNGSGVAVLSTSSLSVGTHSITAAYSGDASFAASTSPVLSQVVQGVIAVISPTAINFGNQTVGTASASQTVTLTNTGNVTLTLSRIALGLNNGTAAQTNNCGGSLAAGASCMVVVSWTPSITGSMTGSLTFADNAPNSPQVVSLSGVGVLPAVTFSPTKLIFHTQVVFTTSASQTATLTNTGLGILSIAKISVTGPFSQTNTCGTSVAAGASCTFTVTFKPTTIGALAGAISIADNAGNSPQSLALTGFGTYVRLNPTSLLFGNQPVGTKSLPKRITLSNKGSVAVTITGISFTGTNAGDFAETNTCGTSVAAGASCFIQVTFTPSAKGNRAATLSVTDNGGGSPQKVSVAGTGT